MTDYMSPKEVCELIPGMTVSRLAMMRFRATGPRYRKPTPKTVLYSRAEVVEWVEKSSRRGTAPDAA